MDMMNKAIKAINKVIFGKEDVIELLFIALIAKGHVLLESVPGTGKTKLAKSFAKVIDGKFTRVQFTPDVLPSDITGIRFFNPKTENFELRIGPVVTNILLADEINRATPKTQASLLEAMEESQATIDGDTVYISPPFLVMATQNPIESSHGTFPLPEAQLDRFLFQIDIGYPSPEEEKRLLTTYQTSDPFDDLSSIMSLAAIKELQSQVKDVIVTEPVSDYLFQLVNQSRKHKDVDIGISPRGMIALLRATQARALINDRIYVTPEDVRYLAPYVFEHRLILTMEGSIKNDPSQIVQDIIEQVHVPVEYEAD